MMKMSDVNFVLVYDNQLIDTIAQGLPSTRLTSFFIPDYRVDNSQTSYISTLTDKSTCYKLRMDNARYTLFVKEKTYFNAVQDINSSTMSDVLVVGHSSSSCWFNDNGTF